MALKVEKIKEKLGFWSNQIDISININDNALESSQNSLFIKNPFKFICFSKENYINSDICNKKFTKIEKIVQSSPSIPTNLDSNLKEEDLEVSENTLQEKEILKDILSLNDFSDEDDLINNEEPLKVFPEKSKIEKEEKKEINNEVLEIGEDIEMEKLSELLNDQNKTIEFLKNDNDDNDISLNFTNDDSQSNLSEDSEQKSDSSISVSNKNELELLTNLFGKATPLEEKENISEQTKLHKMSDAELENELLNSLNTYDTNIQNLEFMKIYLPHKFETKSSDILNNEINHSDKKTEILKSISSKIINNINKFSENLKENMKQKHIKKQKSNSKTFPLHPKKLILKNKDDLQKEFLDKIQKSIRDLISNSNLKNSQMKDVKKSISKLKLINSEEIESVTKIESYTDQITDDSLKSNI